ncbi:hydroxymethylpyrimidine/phosphomethylpyrimidine kinase [Myxococcota bacterium]|nr:hydroxymethylpyrimidine/phosphomethylpyrimidine kinase [Myxococcota bacterium]
MEQLLIISGHDPSTGSGMAADLRAAHCMGVLPFAIISALTAQGEDHFVTPFPAPPEILQAQLHIARGYQFHAVKIGMLGTADTVVLISRWLASNPVSHVVLDPVLHSTSGGVLLSPPTLSSLIPLLPFVTLITPNFSETQLLTGITPQTQSDMSRAAEVFARHGTKATLFKGGHREGMPTDYLWHHGKITAIEGTRIGEENVRGTGCWLSTLIAAMLARGTQMEQACREAKSILTQQMMRAHRVSQRNAQIL